MSCRYCVAERLRHDRTCSPALEILEARRVVVVEVDLLRVEDVEHDQVVAEEAQRLDRVEDRVGLVVEIGDEQQDAAALEVLGHLVQRRAQVAGPLGLRPIQRVQHHVEVLRRRRHVRDDVVVEGDDADAVALAVREIGEAGAEKRSVFELR